MDTPRRKRGRRPRQGTRLATGPWKTVVVDDDAPARRALAALLGQYDRIQLIGEHDHTAGAVADIRYAQADLLFADAEMPGATELDAVRTETEFEAAPIVVYTTANADHAIRWRDVHAFDYLLKPFSEERFAYTMARVLWALERSYAMAVRERPRVVAVRETERTLVVPVAEIDWIEARDYCTRMHIGQQRAMVRRSLQSLLEELSGDGFMRTHRSALVNVTRVLDVCETPFGDADALMANGDLVQISPSYRPRLENRVRAQQTYLNARAI
jgi:two-component system, LytTR family, response regulator